MAILPSSFTLTTTGPLNSNPTAVFVRPADTTAYAIGDLVANSTTAGSVVPLDLPVSRTDSGSVSIERVKLRKSGVSTTNASFRVHLFSAAPTPTVGDNAAFGTSGSNSYLGSTDVVVSQAFSDGACGFSDANFKSISVRLEAGYSVYGLVEARAAYVPVSAESFTVTLLAVQG